jgi:predicted nucleotidyltransferase
MATEPITLLDIVADHLENRGVPFALIGAAALAIHGISRSTFDIDLLVTDRGVLDAAFWGTLPPTVTCDIRPGDSTDPLAGVIRFRATGERDVDIVIGRGAWQTQILGRAEPTQRGGREIPTARADDLILLKLYAGGSQDRWDIAQLLDRPDRSVLIEAVERILPQLPMDAQQLWWTLRGYSEGGATE